MTAAGTPRARQPERQDIYAVTAPLAVEAVEWILNGRTHAVGVTSAGAIFDAADFLQSPAPHITVEPFGKTGNQ